MLHVSPPMSTHEPLRNAKDLVNGAGFVDVNKDTMQHVKYPNVFAIGDCSGSPNSKTAAAAGKYYLNVGLLWCNVVCELKKKQIMNINNTFAAS